MATRDDNLIWENFNAPQQITNEETPDMVDSGPAPKTLQDMIQRLSSLDIDGLEDGEGKDEALRFLFAAIEVIEDEIAYQAKVKAGAPDVNSAFGKPSFAGADQHAQESDEGYEEGSDSFGYNQGKGKHWKEYRSKFDNDPGYQQLRQKMQAEYDAKKKKDAAKSEKPKH